MASAHVSLESQIRQGWVEMMNMHIVVTKIHRFLFGPQIGDVYESKNYPGNPFQPPPVERVEVVDLRGGWVEYQYPGKMGFICQRSIPSFTSMFSFIDKKRSNDEHTN